MKCFQKSQEIANKYSDNGGNTFREILKLRQFMDKCREIPIDYLLELILSANIPSSEIDRFEAETGLNSISKSLKDLNLKIEKGYLCFDNFVKYKIINPKNYQIKTHFTLSQKETLMNMMIGLLAERPILLTGDIGTGKTFIVEQLADLIGANLKVIQFNTETTSLDIIGRLELTIDKKIINDLKESIKDFINLLIKERYEKITELIVETEMLDIPKIRDFFSKEDENFLLHDSENIFNKYAEIKELLSLKGIKMTHFNFNLSALIKAMEKGDWVLLDDINFAPQEIEGLMSLLEEEPTLTIYEDDPVRFYTKDKTKIKDDKKDFEINPNFRLIMTTSNDKNISQAIKSRCLCIKIKPFKEPKDYAELIVNNLKYTDIADKNIINNEGKIGYGFYKLKEEEEQTNYILKNYILSSVNLVYLSKMIIIEQPIDDKKLAKIIEFCFFSAFKNPEKKKKIIKSFKKNIQEDINFEITPIRNIKRSHEHYLKKCEIIIFSYYYNKNIENEKKIETMNNKIHKRFINYKEEFKENLIYKDFKEEEKIIQDIPRKNLLENLESFTLPEIKEYINDIDEVISIFKDFIEEKDKLYQYFYFLIYLKKIFNNLSIINEEKLYGIKINKMDCKIEFFKQYHINENVAALYAKDLIWIQNMIKYFNEIIPENITILNLEDALISIYYKYFKKEYKTEFSNRDIEKLFPFWILSNKNLRNIAKKFEFFKENCKEKELYNILKCYDDIINIDIEKKEIHLEKYNILINLKKIEDIKVIKEVLEIKSDVQSEINNHKKKNIIYYYPNQYYEEENLLKIFFFYNLFVKEIIDDNELKKIIPNELYELNLLLDSYLKENKELDKQVIWDNIYNFKNIVKNGYKLLEGIRKVKDKNNIKFSKGIDLFKTIKVNIENIDLAIEKIDIINNYLKNKWLAIDNKYKILNEKKDQFISVNEKNMLKIKIKELKTEYKNILTDENYKFLTEDLNQIKNQDELENIKKKIEQINSSIKLEEKNIKRVSTHIKENSPNIKILYTYSKLFSIIEKFLNKTSTIEFINRVVNFQKLMKRDQPKIDLLSAYNETIFSTGKENSPVSPEIIIIFKHIANSYLISEIIKNNLEDTFSKYFDGMKKVEENIIKEMHLFFDDDEYIYLPELEPEDIIYCFKYGKDHFQSGELNPTKINQIFLEKNKSKFSLYWIKNKLEDEFSKVIDDENLKQIKSYLKKICVFYKNMEKIQKFGYNFNSDWLFQPIENLKDKAIKYPSKIITKYKYKDSFSFEEKNFDFQKIKAKVFYALFEAEQNISTIFSESDNGFKDLIEEIITYIQNSKKRYCYGYRIMEFYDFHLFEDYSSRTMILIIETIYDILEQKFKNCFNNDIKNILKKVLTDLIILVLSSKSPKFENTKAVDFFKIIYYSFLKSFKTKYGNIRNMLKNNKTKLCKLVSKIKERFFELVKMEIKDYDRKYNLYEEDILQYEKEKGRRALDYYNKHYVKNFVNNITFKTNKAKNYESTDDFHNWKKNRASVQKPYKDSRMDNYKVKIEKICENLKALEKTEDINEILKLINSNKLDKNNFIESNDYQVYLDLLNNINSNINCLKKLNDSYSFLNIQIPTNIQIENIEENDIDIIYKVITKLKKYSLFFSLFEIDKIQMENNYNILNLIPINIYGRHDFNFIFKNENNKPVFLNKNMKINLGLYIIGYELKNIGSISIPNSYSEKLKYTIKNDEHKEIIIFSENNKVLNPCKDLKINFRLDFSPKIPEFYSFEFKLILFDENEEFDKCTIYAYINFIPLIIKFSIPNEKFSLFDKNISISNFRNNLKILHFFPGNYCSEKLGIKLKGDNLKNKIEIKQENTQHKGQILIKTKNNDDENKLNLEFNLSLLSLELLNFKIKNQNPLRIFNETFPDLKKVKIIKKMKKSIFLFNMSNNDIKLDFEYGDRYIDLSCLNNEIKQKTAIKIEIKNKNVKNYSNLKINDKIVKIENINVPKIKLNEAMLEVDSKDVGEKNLKEFTLITIDKNFKIKKQKIEKEELKDYNIFSIYLINKNEIISKNVGKYSFEKNKKGRKIYGFSNEKFELFTYNNMKKLIVKLSYKIDNFGNFDILFSEDERIHFKNKINIFKDEIIANNNFNECVTKLILKNIDIFDEKSVGGLNIDKNINPIENIIIFLLKYSLKFETVEEFRNYLQNIYEEMYKFSERKIKKYFQIRTEEKKIKGILDKLSYIISFTALLVSPGELLEYEYKEGNNIYNEKNTENQDIKVPKVFLLESKNYKEDNISNRDIIYYNDKITLHEENDEYSKYERQILGNDIKIDEKTEEPNQEFINSCCDEINKITNDISNNNINISNFLFLLESSKKLLMKIPYIFSKKENEKQLNICINGIQFIYDYLIKLSENKKKTGFMSSKFGQILLNYSEEFESFLSKFECFKTVSKNLSNNISFEHITKCELPSDNKKENIIYDDKEIFYNKEGINGNYLTGKTKLEQYNSELQFNLKYENKKDLNFKKKDNRYKIINLNKEITDEERKYLSLEGILDDYKSIKKDDINKNLIKHNLKTDLTDFKEELFEIKDIRKLYGDIKNISATKFLKDIMNIVKEANQKYSIIRDKNKISDLKIDFEKNPTYPINSEFWKVYSHSSTILQNIVSNLIRKILLIYNEKEILPHTIKNSFLDILVDISATMSEEQRISSLILCTGLSLSFSKYGVKIRISVFGERDCVWVLTEDFSSNNLPLQLSRLRDALSLKKRIQSFPADALRKLKNSFNEKYDNKYCQILISNLISSQIVDKNLNWNILGQKIIIFGLKSNFDENFQKEFQNIYESILKPISDEAQITQEFFEPLDIISQSEKINNSYSKLVNVILDNIIDNNEEMEDHNIKEIIINYKKNDDININNNIERLKEYITDNLDEKKYFSQNVPLSTLNLSKFQVNKIPKINKFPTLSELEKLSLKNVYNINNSLEEIISYIITLLTPLFRQIMPSNIPSGKIPCTSGGSLSIQGIKRWICTGFTYSYIFEKLGGKNMKKYNLSYIIDLSKSALLLCNYSHCIATIVLLLIAPSTIEDNEEIYIDVIINTVDGIKIVDFNSKCSLFQNLSKINEIIKIIDEETSDFCCPGSCVYTAYRLLSERREDKKIFLITDGFVSDKYEIQLVLRLIENCQNEGIEFITIGVGLFPNGIKEVYPKCCYSPSIRNLQDSLFSCFLYSKESYSNSFNSNLIKIFFKEDLKKKLSDILEEEPKDKLLEESISDSPITSFVNMIYNENSVILDGFTKKIVNPEEEPYYDVFDDFKILVVILYLGNKEHDTNITTEIFEENTGKSLRKKGFKYDIVYSYGDAINKISALDNNNCPYSEIWIFCSKGDGTLPEKAKDKDPNKITTFLKMVADFNKNGGALFLFCDNYPFVLEANLLLKEYIQFKGEKINFEMKGNYNNENPEERFIYEKEDNNSKNGFFQPEHFLESPGKAHIRLSLRIGLNKFSEGITLSYAETFDNSEDYRPFTPFAYLTDPGRKRPFILYYDPKIETIEKRQGPIVVHGGFTSAFYDFQQDGTGRLVISIACWLIRKEEIIMNRNSGIETIIPRIIIPKDDHVIFDKWIKNVKARMYSILILDISGSMKKYYQSLCDMANQILEKQMKNEENEGVVILFRKEAKAVITGKFRLLNLEKDIYCAGLPDGTNFFNAFSKAKEFIYNKKYFDYKRILFLTDGKDFNSKLKTICDEMIKENFQINIIGFKNAGKDMINFEHLKEFASENCFFTSNNFKEIEIICKNIFAAE